MGLLQVPGPRHAVAVPLFRDRAECGEPAVARRGAGRVEVTCGRKREVDDHRDGRFRGCSWRRHGQENTGGRAWQTAYSRASFIHHWRAARIQLLPRHSRGRNVAWCSGTEQAGYNDYLHAVPAGNLLL